MSSVVELQPSTTVTAVQGPEIRNTMAKQDHDFRELLSVLTLEEKVRLLSGESFTAAAGVKRLNISPIKVADSTSGVRPSQHDSDMTTACFPNTTCLASTWDVEALEDLGEKLATQAKMKSAQVVLGPNINMHRDPRGGRNFEAFSEDPLLAGHLAGAVVRGVQRHGVGSCPKHFVCNDSEYMRHYYNVDQTVDGRPLREIYLAAWSHLLRVCDPVAIMMAYVFSLFYRGHYDLIERVLRKSWGFKGLVMSDWFGTRSTVEAIKAGLDLEMPFPVHRGPKVIEAIKSGQVSEADIDERVIKHLDLRNRTRESHADADAEEYSEIEEATNQTARKLAEGGIILLKNENGTLPLDPNASAGLAVIGEFGRDAVVTGGGSASCNPQYRIPPVDALKDVLADASRMTFSQGVKTRRIIPLAPVPLLQTPDGHAGVEIKYINDSSPDSPILVERREKPSVWMMGEFPAGLQVPGSCIELNTNFKCPSNGKHTLAVRRSGAFRLYVNGEEVLTGPQPDVTTEQFIFNHILLESRVEMAMEEGAVYAIKLVVQSRDRETVGEPTPYAASLCFEEFHDEDQTIIEAMEVARAADTSIVFAGRDGQYESEGYDLEEIALPRNQVALIKAVASASKKTILVLHCGNPIDVSAVVDDVDAIICAHFPGQEGSRALADILTGNVNPSGRTATTWWKTLQDAPSFGDFPAQKDNGGDLTLKYQEGLQIGYRHPKKERVQWPFGYGLSYTTFEYSDLMVAVSGAGSTITLECSVTLTNSGSMAGHEVVQVYVTPAKGSRVWRPEQELKMFTKVFLTPGESKTVSLKEVLRVACSYWDETEKQWRMEEGVYGVLVGQLHSAFTVSDGEHWDGL
ncbi:glycoside hydrolase superfamily [Aspergillus pseudoustus]|uniref:beta-glucosidase n=1 Tax=Aspergillus pseudoustus TaxID=1810923 RepID=A0ABR4JTI2_9EURO